MFKPIVCLALIVCAAAGAGHAQTVPHPAQVAPARPLVDLADLAALNPPYASPYAPIPRPGDGSPTAVDYSLAPEGLAASVGFVCDNDGHTPLTHGASPLAGSEPGRLIGTTLRVGF